MQVKDRIESIGMIIMDAIETLATEFMPDKIEMALESGYGYLIQRNDEYLRDDTLNPLGTLQYNPDRTKIYPASQELVDKKIHSWLTAHHRAIPVLHMVVNVKEGMMEMGNPSFLPFEDGELFRDYPEIGLKVLWV